MEPLQQLFQQGRYREVFDQSRDSSDPRILLIHVKAALELGEAAYAREILGKLPPFAEAALEGERLALLGWSHLALGEPEIHQQLVRQAAQLHQGYSTLLHLAHALPPTEAITALKEALVRASNPQEEGRAAHTLAMVLERQGRFREGYSYASLAYLRLPHDPVVAITYARLAIGGSDELAPGSLLSLLEGIATTDNLAQRATALNQITDLYLLLGQPQKALETLERNMNLLGRDQLMAISVIAVRVYRALGMREQAVALVRAAQLTSVSYPVLQGNLKLALGLALYPHSEAANAFAEAIELYGTDMPLGVLIARVYLAELHQEKLDTDALKALEQWSRHALSLYPPLLQASRRGGYRLKVLGTSQLTGPEGPVPLRPRGMEMLVLLLSRLQGWEREELCEALYGSGRTRAFRSEVFRLKTTLEGMIEPRPWRVTQPISADFLEVRYWLERGEVGAALAAYSGPLLPHSQAPGIEELRRELEEDLRQAVLARRDPDLMFALANVMADELELLERLLEVLPHADWRSPIVWSRVNRLRKAYL